MFGYLRPYTPELRVREHEMYRAVYCGLCRTMGRVTGQASRLTLSYDFVFLALCRMLLTDDVPTMHRRRCAVHPLRRRQIADECESLRYTARVSAHLCGGKVDDDRVDERGARRLGAVLLTPAVCCFRRRADRGSDGALGEAVRRGLTREAETETADCPSPDASAAAFGELCGDLFSFGLTDTAARIAHEIGCGVGRFIYIADAADDLADDRRRGRFNPLLSLYGDGAVERRDDRDYLRRETAEEIMTAALLELRPLGTAIELACDGGDRTAAETVRNIVYLGMPEALRRTLSRRCGLTDGGALDAAAVGDRDAAEHTDKL